MAALRSQLMGLVDEARQKEQVKSQERLQNLTTTERLPIPEKLENYKFATLCPSQWDAMSGSDQYRHCQECGLFVYEFATQNQSEAAKIVFQREGNDRPTFYKRGDGRFLTRDCPVGVGRRQKRILGMVAAMVVGLGAVALMFLAPPPKPPEVMQQPEPNWEDEEIVDEPKSKKKVAPAGEGHARFSLPKARPQPSEYNNNDQAPILTPPDIGVPPQ
jgi:hypothetical protein